MSIKKIPRKIILIDLDGVLNEYKGLYNKDFIPPIKKGAKDLIKKISKQYEIRIFTTRNKLLTAEWLINNKIDKYIYDITNVKDSGTYLFIDDRCINFNGNFDELYKSIKNFKTHWEIKN